MFFLYRKISFSAPQSKDIEQFLDSNPWAEKMPLKWHLPNEAGKTLMGDKISGPEIDELVPCEYTDAEKSMARFGPMVSTVVIQHGEAKCLAKFSVAKAKLKPS